MQYGNFNNNRNMVLKDYGDNPLVINLDKAVQQNNNFRLALWTGEHFQITIMCLKAYEEIGFEIHNHLDQMLKVVSGFGMVIMGKDEKGEQKKIKIGPGSAIIVPMGTNHNVVNTSQQPLKLYSIYAPPQHPFGTVQKNKSDE